MDFYQIRTRRRRTESLNYILASLSEDRLISWLEGETSMPSGTRRRGCGPHDEYDVARLIDEELHQESQKEVYAGQKLHVKDMRSYETQSWAQFQKFIGQIGDNSHQLDVNLTFANTPVKKNDYVSRRLPYALEPGDYSAGMSLSARSSPSRSVPRSNGLLVPLLQEMPRIFRSSSFCMVLLPQASPPSCASSRSCSSVIPRRLKQRLLVVATASRNRGLQGKSDCCHSA
jgi:hypothetical protein